MIVKPSNFCNFLKKSRGSGFFSRGVHAGGQGYYAEKTPITRMLWNARQDHSISKHEELDATAPTERPKLVEKPPNRVDVTYDFTHDESLKGIYTDSSKSVLFQKLVEDLDALAGNVAFFHCDDGDPSTPPVSLVTASIDEIRILQKVSIDRNILLSGQVVYVGKSSMDVLVEGHYYDGGQEPPLMGPSKSRVLSSVFTYVARDRGTGKAALVNPLSKSALSALEADYFAERERLVMARKARKQAQAKGASNEVDVTARDAMVRLVDAGKAMVDMPALAHAGRVLMGSTVLENSFICQPQKSNTAGNVFGGYLLHQACSLASSSIYMFSGQTVNPQLVNKIEFQRPVHIGDLIRLRSRISYLSSSTPRKAVCDITCHIVKPEKVSTCLSNRFSFIFELEDCARLKAVQPCTKEEVLALFDAAAQVHGDNTSEFFAEYEQE